MERIRIDEAEIAKLEKHAGVALQLLPAAEQIMVRAQGKAPPWLRSEGRWYTRAGVSRRSGFAQAIVAHPGAVGAEYGGERSPAFAMFRSSI